MVNKADQLELFYFLDNGFLSLGAGGWFLQFPESFEAHFKLIESRADFEYLVLDFV